MKAKKFAIISLPTPVGLVREEGIEEVTTTSWFLNGICYRIPYDTPIKVPLRLAEIMKDKKAINSFTLAD